MTNRAEIERLLKMTGRTLEGLPTQEEYCNLKDYGDRCEELDRALSEGGFESTYPCMFHQSDVIELLAGALRDALDNPMQKPLTLEELRAEPTDSYVWEERKNGIKTYFERTSTLVLAHMCINSKDEIYKYGRSLRAWKRIPTDEEMEAAIWES